MKRLIFCTIGRALQRFATFANEPRKRVAFALAKVHGTAIVNMTRLADELRSDPDPCILCGSPGGTHEFRDDGRCYLPNRMDYRERVKLEPRLRAELARREERGAA